MTLLQVSSTSKGCNLLTLKAQYHPFDACYMITMDLYWHMHMCDFHLRLTGVVGNGSHLQVGLGLN